MKSCRILVLSVVLYAPWAWSASTDSAAITGPTPEVGASLRLGSSGALTWDDAGNPGPFRIYRGFRKPGRPWTYDHVCLGNPIAGTTGVDPLTPLPSSIFYYLITREGPDGESIPGRDSSGNPIPDGACPFDQDPDRDGFVEAVDDCPFAYNPGQEDRDNDRFGDACDNCPRDYNPAQEDANLDGQGDACEGLCAPGDERPCYDAPPATAGVGICRVGMQVCMPDGLAFSSCFGEVLPESSERCDGMDNDCDGAVDEDIAVPCYDGPPGSEGIGACRAGHRECSDGSLGACLGEVLPSGEGPFGDITCVDHADNDCDNLYDTAEPGCRQTCGNGVVEPGEACDDGNADTSDGCLPSCVRAGCGDGFVRSGIEQCEFGHTESCGGRSCIGPWTSGACTCCPPGDPFAVPIPAGVDGFDSGAALGIEILASVLPGGVVERLRCSSTGLPPAIIQRGALNLATGRIDTEITSLDLRCTSQFAGEIRVVQSPDRRTLGAIDNVRLRCVGGATPGLRCTRNDECCGGTCGGSVEAFHSGHSFFDVFFEVRIPSLNLTLVNYATPPGSAVSALQAGSSDFPVRMEANISSLPPAETVYLPPAQTVPLCIKGTDTQVATLIHAAHQTATCGDGVTSYPAEDCDFGDRDPCDGCSADCHWETTRPGRPGPDCEDGNFCTVDDYCSAGACVPGVPRDCSFRDDDCAVGTCDGDLGCYPAARPGVVSCNDHNDCTGNDRCDGVKCRGTPNQVWTTVCDDDSPCTSFAGLPGGLDRCDGAGHCAGDPVNCDDPDFCNGEEHCTDGTCTHSGNPCAGSLHCNEELDFCECQTAADCADMTTACATGVCTPHGCATVPKGPETLCDDGFSCTFDDHCDPVTGKCKGRRCDDGDACNNGIEFCTEGMLICLWGANPCGSLECVSEGDNRYRCLCDTDADCAAWTGPEPVPCRFGWCDAGTCKTSYAGPEQHCDDGKLCTTHDYIEGSGDWCDGSGHCWGLPVVCVNDGNQCTRNECDPDSGCYPPYREGTYCDDDGVFCASSQCNGAGDCSPVSDDCNHGNQCTYDACDLQTGDCSHLPLTGAACDDDHACTENDSCDATGRCGGGFVQCQTGPCFGAACSDVIHGCLPVYLPDGTPCEDGDPETSGEQCMYGTCSVGTPMPLPKTCREIRDAHPGMTLQDGIYTIYPSSGPMQAYCDMTTDGGGWTAVFAGRNGTTHVFDHFDAPMYAGICTDPATHCLRRAPALLGDSAAEIAVSCGGAMVKAAMTGAVRSWLISGASSGWVHVSPEVIAGTVPNPPDWVYTGIGGSDPSFIFALGQASGAYTFASSDGNNAAFDYCNGVADHASLVRVFYREAAPTPVHNTPQTARRSCRAILDASESAGDGTYWLVEPGGTPYQAYCDMTTDGGGWTAVFAGRNGTTNVFDHFDAPLYAGICTDPASRCLQRAPAYVGDSAAEIAVSCGGAMVKAAMTGAVRNWLISGAPSGWGQVSPQVIAGTVPNPPDWVYTGIGGSEPSFIFALGQASGAYTFASSDGNNAAHDYCNGVPDQASLVRVFYRETAPTPVGNTPQTARRSCRAILDASESAGDGIYWLVEPGGTPYQAYCDMTTDGGGWTAVFAGRNGTTNVFDHFDAPLYAGTCTDPASRCLQRAPAYVGDSAAEIAVSCGGAMVKAAMTGAVRSWLISGAPSGWGQVSPQVIAGAVPNPPDWVYTGIAGSDPSFIFALGQASGAYTFASSDGNIIAHDYCNGVADQASLVRVFYRETAPTPVRNTPQTARRSCRAILDASESTGDGIYWLVEPGGVPYQAYCDMTTDGGGWTAVFAGRNGTTNVFDHFDAPIHAGICTDPASRCLRRAPADVGNSAAEIAVSCGGAMVKAAMTGAVRDWLISGTPSGWGQVSPQVIAGTVQNPPDWVYTGIGGSDPSFIFALGQASGGYTFASSDGSNAVFDYCNGVADAVSLVRILYR